jgi:hypothetical protein
MEGFTRTRLEGLTVASSATRFCQAGGYCPDGRICSSTVVRRNVLEMAGQYRTVGSARPQELVFALSRLKHGFESRWKRRSSIRRGHRPITQVPGHDEAEPMSMFREPHMAPSITLRIDDVASIQFESVGEAALDAKADARLDRMLGLRGRGAVCRLARLLSPRNSSQQWRTS